jgi:hypothetical protein
MPSELSAAPNCYFDLRGRDNLAADDEEIEDGYRRREGRGCAIPDNKGHPEDVRSMVAIQATAEGPMFTTT